MHKIFLSILLFAAFTSCNDKNNDVNLQERLKKDTSVAAQQIIFAEPLVIDSSRMVIYPLILETESFGKGYGYKRGGESQMFWNLIFYNVEAATRNLLTSDKKIMISSIILNSPSSSNAYGGMGSSGINIFNDHIVYSVISADYDSNKILDQNDPGYIYVSARDGKNFRQVSPEGYHIDSWHEIKGTSKIIMTGRKDGNRDKKFNENDSPVPLVVDLNSNTQATEAFKPEFVDSLKKKLVTIWKAQ
jgi:hypothetical protein